jgi:septum formation protein
LDPAGNSSPPPRLVLASASPRRQELLREAGYRFVTEPANVDEDSYPDKMLPGDLAEYLAFLKAEAVAERFPNDVVLGADTVVAFGDTILGKPDDDHDARRMLELLSGTTHVVVTGVAVVRKSAGLVRRSRVLSAVHMRPMSLQEIDAYVASGEWRGKAGGYGIQDPDPFVTRKAGSHSNIVGLPMDETRRLLAEAGVGNN